LLTEEVHKSPRTFFFFLLLLLCFLLLVCEEWGFFGGLTYFEDDVDRETDDDVKHGEKGDGSIIKHPFMKRRVFSKDPTSLPVGKKKKNLSLWKA
jgi:hypothetical protein